MWLISNSNKQKLGSKRLLNSANTIFLPLLLFKVFFFLLHSYCRGGWLLFFLNILTLHLWVCSNPSVWRDQGCNMTETFPAWQFKYLLMICFHWEAPSSQIITEGSCSVTLLHSSWKDMHCMFQCVWIVGCSQSHTLGCNINVSSP